MYCVATMGEMNRGGHLDLDPKSRLGFKIHPKPDKKSGSGFKLHPNPNEKSGKVGIVLMFPDFRLPIGGSRDCPQCSPILSGSIETIPTFPDFSSGSGCSLKPDLDFGLRSRWPPRFISPIVATQYKAP